MNSYVQFFSDDLQCTYFENHQINSLSDIFNVLRFDFENVNGRIIPCLLVLLTVRAGEFVFNIVNTIFTVTAFALMWRVVSYKDKENELLSLFLLAIAFLLLSTGVDSLYYWAASASNYVWTIIPSFAFLLLIEKANLNKISSILLIILGVFLGLQHEIYACPIAGAYWIVILLRKKKFSAKQWMLFIGFTIGMLIIALAPGNFIRGSVFGTGFGVVGRIVKILYFLRMFYIMIFAVIISFIINRKATINFLRSNVILELIIALGFVIPFLVAGNSRSVYGIELFSLVLLVKLLDGMLSVSKTVNNVITAVAALFLCWFQGSIVYASSIKWGIYNKTVWQYDHQKSNTVVMDDVQCNNSLIEYYTVNMNNILTPYDKANQLALQKARLYGINYANGEAPDSTLIKIIPANIKTMKAKRIIPSLGLADDPQMRYYVMPYKEGVVDKINHGYFYAMYNIPVVNKKLKINYLEGDVDFERAAYDITYEGKRYILLNKKYKHYPFIKLLYMGFNNQQPTNKLEIEK